MDDKYKDRLLKILRLYRQPGSDGEKAAAKEAFIKIWQKAQPNKEPDFDFDKDILPPPVTIIRIIKKDPYDRAELSRKSMERWNAHYQSFLAKSSEFTEPTRPSNSNYHIGTAVHQQYDDFECPHCHTHQTILDAHLIVDWTCSRCCKLFMIPDTMIKASGKRIII